MKEENNDRLTLKQFKNKNYGKRGTAKRERLEKGYQDFKIEEIGLGDQLQLSIKL